MTFRPGNYDASVRTRGAVEHAIVIKTVNDLLHKGYLLSVRYNKWDGDELSPTDDIFELDKALMECDDEYLTVYAKNCNKYEAANVEPDTDPDNIWCRNCNRTPFEHEDKRPISWVHFVYGNDGWDVISDYPTNIEEDLKEVEEFAEKIGNGDFDAMAKVFSKG